MANGSGIYENKVKPNVYPQLQNKDKVVVSKVATTRSGKVSGQIESSVKS